MGRNWTRLVSVVTAVVLVSSGVAASASMQPVNDDWDMQREIDTFVQATPPGEAVLGRSFVDRPFFNSSKLWADFTGQTCPAIDKGLCAKANVVLATVVFPHCSAKRTSDCVESLFTRDGRKVEAQPAGSFRPDNFSTFPAFELFDGTTIPASGELALFRVPSTPHSSGDLYGLSMSLGGVLSRMPQGWVPQPLEVSAHLVPVSLVPRSEAEPACKDPDHVSGDTCLRSDHRLPDARFGATVRVGPTFGSWVFGRVADLSIDVATSRGVNRLTVEGRPAATPEALGMAYCEPATDFLGQTCPYIAYQVWSAAAGSPNSLGTWRTWAPYIGSASDAIIRRWSFGSNGARSSSLATCLTPGQLSGWISTDVMVFQAEPPAWNGRSLDFGVAGPPLTPDGQRASGDYEFFLRSDVAECLWKGRNVAKQATVQVIDAGASSQVTTTSVGESKGWVRFVARNFGFPDVPTLRSDKAASVKIPKISIRMKGKKR